MMACFPGLDLVCLCVGNGGTGDTESEGLGGEVLGKNSEVLGLASAQPVVLLSVLLSPPVKWK